MIAAKKQSLRERMRQMLGGMGEESRREESRRLALLLRGEPRFRAAKRIFAFFPLRSEPRILDALDAGQILLLPKVCGPRLAFFPVEAGALPSEPGRWEPESHGDGFLPESGDLVLVPGLAFCITGERLGRGGGYFDRFLEGCHAPAWGVAFRCQLLEDLPVEPHDVVLQRVLTAPPVNE